MIRAYSSYRQGRCPTQSALPASLQRGISPCFYYETELELDGGPTTVVALCLGNVFPKAMTCLISWRSWFIFGDASGIIHMGKYGLEEIKPDVPFPNGITMDRRSKLFNQSTENHLHSDAVA